MVKKTIPITQARKEIFKIAEDVQHPDTYYEITIDGKSKVIVMSRDEFVSIMETMDVMSDPDMIKELRESEEDFRRGDYVTLDEIKDKIGIRSADLILRDKAKSSYQAKKNDKKTSKR